MESENLSALPAGTRLQEYTILSVLGMGGFGITYLAEDGQLGMRVAIKEYLPCNLAVRAADSTVLPRTRADAETYRWGLERFLNEVRTLARFRHPNIVRVLRYFEGNGTAYTVMEYEEGQSFAAYLAEHPSPLPEGFLLACFMPLLDGLTQVHAAGFLHRDIKPANIYLRRDGSPVLLDFGSARQALGDHTQTLTSIITPGYAPFEQYAAGENQGPWTDIYALGAVLYRAISGATPQDAAARFKQDRLTPARELARGQFSERFLAAIDCALELQETRRPQSVAAWRAVLLGQDGDLPGDSALPVLRSNYAPPQAPRAPDGDVRTSSRRASPRGRDDRPATGSGLRWSRIFVIALILLACGLTFRWLSRAPRPENALPMPAQDAPRHPRPEARPLPAPEDARTFAPAEQPEPATPRDQIEREAVRRRFIKADRDGDGRLSQIEAELEFPVVARNFMRIDQNRDGYLTLDEVIRALEEKRNDRPRSRDDQKWRPDRQPIRQP